MKQAIINYLKGPRDWNEGVSLYMKYGQNRMLRKVFLRRDENSTLRITLIEELRKLSGLSATQLANLRRMARSENRQEPPKNDAVLADADKGEPEKANATVSKMVRFREQFPFLSQDDCPDELKVLVADMFTALGRYKETHAELVKLPDNAELQEAANLAEQAVENYLANREMWEELDYYKAHGKVLGKCAKLKRLAAEQELAAMDDVTLMKKVASARTNASKKAKALAGLDENSEEYAKVKTQADTWNERKQMLEAELSRRKKD